MADLEKLARARAAFESMPARTRTIFIACRIEGLSHAEVARREGLYRWQVRRHMRRALLIVQQALR